jgi:hypothetical protein
MSRLTTMLFAGSALAGAGLIGAAGFAAAQMGSAFDPAQLPTVTGKVAQYLPTPRGDVDGILLDDGTQVHLAPRLSTQLVFAVHPGDSVTIHGLKARAEPLVDAASITNDATKLTVIYDGPHGLRDEAPIEVSGHVKAPLYGFRGEVNGVLLDNGAVIHMPPPEATRMAAQLAVGQAIVARGDGFSGPLGQSIGAHEIGPDAAHLTAVAGPRPDWEHWMHERFGHMHHGPDHGAGPAGPGPDGPGAPPPPPPPQ